MKYIDRKNKQLIIDTPIHKSTTKSITKDGKEKENIKYITHIPNEILIFLLEHLKPFDATECSDAEYIDAMLNGKEKVYLSFYNHPGKDSVELSATNERFVQNDTISVTVNKQVTSKSYFFTVSKKIFNELKGNNDYNYSFKYCLSLDCDDYYFKNSIVDVMLI